MSSDEYPRSRSISLFILATIETTVGAINFLALLGQSRPAGRIHQAGLLDFDLRLAADLQLASAFPDTGMVEYLTGSPFIDEITLGGWQLDGEGMLPIPALPGLGLKLDPDALVKYASGARLLDCQPSQTTPTL